MSDVFPRSELAQGWSFDMYCLRHEHADAGVAQNWNEINAEVTWHDNRWLAIGDSTDAMASGTIGTYALVGARYPVNDKWHVEGALARYFRDSAYVDRQTRGFASAAWVFQSPFEVRSLPHGTNSAARRLFPDMTGSRIEVVLQASFRQSTSQLHTPP